MEGLEGSRKALGFLVLRGVIVNRWIKDRVGNKAAVGAVTQRNVAFGKVHGNFARRHQQHAMHRHPWNLVEDAHVALQTVWAGFNLRHFLIPIKSVMTANSCRPTHRVGWYEQE